ncbi:MAG: SDR family oxidoreductase [Sediminicola sp.]|tara:strand:+ start:77445 stop:78254 length:810 start_codon:yes stop_codon:yes gene_type:complete
MDHKVVLVTGGSSGIGKSIGTYLVAKGLTVYGTTRTLEKSQGFDGFTLLRMDVGNPETILAACNEIIRREGRLDVVINNAGIGITGPIEETPQEEMQKAFDTNFFGPINVMKAVLPQMRKQKKGLVVNITSIAGYMGLPYRGIYSASKGALELVTEAMRMETKDFGIRITNLAPGDFATNIAAGRYHAPVQMDSPYRLPYGNTLKMMDRDVNNGGDPERVAEKVYDILRKDSPKIHYKVGAFMQRISLLLKKILPDKVFEKLLLNHYKL